MPERDFYKERPMELMQVLATRLKRQHLTGPATNKRQYRQLFASLQPVSPLYFTCPGDPPSLVHRTVFNDKDVTAVWRKLREIVKARFLGGTIGYVFSEELELYANAFQHPLVIFNRTQELIYNTLLHVGPLTPRQIKEETGLLNKEIMPALHRLQEAFLVYEDQLDSDWERAWYIFSSEWPDITIEPERWETAAKEVLRRFIYAHVFADIEQIKDWSGWSAREIRYLLQMMQADGIIVPCEVDGMGEGWMCGEDKNINAPAPSLSVFMLHKADPLVRASMSKLKRRFEGREVLQYLLIDGEFQGAVCGHWRIGPHDVEDIIVQDHAARCIDRKAEIIDAVAFKYRPPSHHILRYSGEPVDTIA